MIDARMQILELLKSIKYKNLKVTMNFPKEIKSVPLITYFEIVNSSTDIGVRDSLSYQIDIWENSFEKVIDLMQLADEKMIDLGFKRDYVSPDDDSVDSSGIYRKTLRYSRYVDTRTGRLIR